MKNINIDFVAKCAGCSPATVSRVLNKSKKVSKELEQRVYDVVAEYNYHPNAMARGLAMKRSRLIGIIFPEQMNQFHLFMLQHINTKVAAEGYFVSLAFAKEGYESFVAAYERLQQQNVEIVFWMMEISKEEEIRLRSRCIKTKIVNMNEVLWDGHYREKNEKAIYDATNYLIRLGHRVIGGVFAEDERKNSFVSARKRGFQMALKEHSLPYIDEIVLDDVQTMAEANRRVGAIMQSRYRPTALVCYSDETAIGVMLYLLQNGVKIPEDISVIGLDGIPLGKCMVPRLTTMQFPMEHYTDNLIQYIINILEEKNIRPGLDEKMQYELIENGSCRRLL